MPRFVIERDVPGAGHLSTVELRAISKQSVGVVEAIGHGLTWVQTFVTDDKMYCVYDAPSVELIHEHARCMGIPANFVAEVRVVIDPKTADG